MCTTYARKSAAFAELRADAHYYFAHSFNSPWGSKASSMCPVSTYTLSHQGWTSKSIKCSTFWLWQKQINVPKKALKAALLTLARLMHELKSASPEMFLKNRPRSAKGTTARSFFRNRCCRFQFGALEAPSCFLLKTLGCYVSDSCIA